MKFNGNNIILDEDITMTGDLSGEQLSDIIREQRSDIEKLKSNVKWIYKYGGVGGSGGSGGGGGASGFVLYAELGNVQMNNQSVAYNGAGNYNLYIKITRPNGASFKVTYTYDVLNSSGTTTQASTTVTLDVSNDYSYSRVINLNCNGRITVKAVDSVYSEIKSAFTDYIIESYKVKSELVDNLGTPYGSTEIFMDTAKEKGLKLRVSYEVAIQSSGNNTCELTFSKGSQSLTETVQLAGSSGYYDFDIGGKYIELTEENSGYYSVKTVVRLDLQGQLTEPIETIISFNLVPQQLYLLVAPTVGTIYTEEQKGDDYYEFSSGFIGFNLRPYLGSYTQSTAVIRYRVVTYDSAGNPDYTNDNTGDGIQVRLGSQANITIFSTTVGHNEIQFKVDAMGSTYPNTAGPNITSDGYIRYHFYVSASEANIDWYDPSTSGTFNYYRLDKRTSSFDSFNALAGGNIYQQTSNKGEVVIKPVTLPANVDSANYDTNIAIGIQYNEVNSDDSYIIRGMRTKSSTRNQTFSITQNKITIGDESSGTTFNYFLGKTRDYNKSATGNYHLINLVSRKVQEIANFKYYEVLVYVDGILEGGCETYISGGIFADELILGETNSFVNLMEISYLSSQNRPLDNAIYQYYLKYKNSILQVSLDSGKETKLLEESAKFTLDGNDVFTSNREVIENIAQVLDVPTLVLVMSEDRKDYLDQSFTENAAVESIDVSVLWARGGSGSTLAELDFPSSFSGSAQFSIKIQGSSTKSYKCKNYTLTLRNTNTSENAGHYVFSPNFVSLSGLTGADKDAAEATFLPEESFTLKADVVDSSHSNNTSIGKFVNDITQDFDTTTFTNTGNSLSGYVKNCLDGFPCVVYLGIPKTENGVSTTYYYYQGVYNFNLGRESFYNLGYKDSSVFCNVDGNPLLENAGEGWTFFNVAAAQPYDIKTGVVVAEIQGNSPYFDFSQSHESILYKSLSGFSSDQETYMFDDFVSGSGIGEAEAKSIIQKMVSKVSKAGGYLFNYIRKSFCNDPNAHYGYDDGYNAVDSNNVPLNQVPNYKKKFVKTTDGSNQIFKVDGEDLPDGTLADVRELIIGTNDSTASHFDFRSLSEYYTICMAFGLVDSVQKNMNIKSWNARPNSSTPAKFYAAFYDMDTCLGINNAGEDVSYFAFSDYWSYDDSHVETDGTVNPSEVTIYRDFSPKSNAAGGTNAADFYDTPSSYLFAVAKYSRLVADQISTESISGSDATQDFPQELWARWRAGSTDPNDKTRGCLLSAEKFINNYFANNLKKVGGPMINLNYRNKYLIGATNGDTKEDRERLGFSHLNFIKFNGTRIAKATDWLDGRFHILDAYFNLPKSASSFMYYNEDGDYVAVPIVGGNAETDFLPEPTYETTVYNLQNNSDIFVLQDIFATDSVNQTSGKLEINVKAKEFSPLIINTANSGTRYLLGGNDTLYHISKSLNGNQTYSFYGSGAWTYLDSINTFNFRTLNVNSKYLERLSGSSSTNGMTIGKINMPSLKDLELTAPAYSGELTINGENYPNLGTVNVSNTGISLTIDNSTVTDVNIANMRNSTVFIQGCTNLKNVNFGSGTSGTASTTLKECHITPMSSSQLANKVTITKSKIGVLELTNTTSTADSANPYGKSTLEINGDDTLSELNVQGISVLRLINCSNLQKVYIADPAPATNGNKPTGDFLTQIYIESCSASNLTLTVGNSTTQSGVIDLTAFEHLSNVTIKSTLAFTDCKLPSDVTLGSSAFSGCQNMRTLSGKNLTFTGTNTFQNCNAYTLRGSDGNYTDLKIGSNVTTLTSMFSCTNGGSINRDAAKHFLEKIVAPNASKITSISGLFGSQAISYTLADLQADLTSSASSAKRCIDLRNFTNLSNVTSAFSWTGISALHPYMFAFGSGVTNISFSSFCVGGSTTLYAPIDIFANIIDKIDILWNNTWRTTSNRYSYTMNIVNSSGTSYGSGTAIKLKDLLRPTVNGVTKSPSKITELGGFTLDPNQTWDVGDAFVTGWDALTVISGFLYNNHSRLQNCNTMFRNTVTNQNGPEKLKRFYECFRVNNSNDPINLYTWLNWGLFVVENENDPFGERSSDRATASFNMTKYIPTKDDFDNLMSILLTGSAGTSATKLTGISNIFRNCTVFIMNTGQNELSLNAGARNSSVSNNNVVNVSHTFDGFRMISTEGEAITESNLQNMMVAEPVAMILADNLFSIIPRVNNLNRCFYGIKLAKALPYNFFGLRRVTSSANKYIKTGPGNDQEDYTMGTYYRYSYADQISDMAYCFANIIWENREARYFDGDPDSLDVNRFVTQDGAVYKDPTMNYYTSRTDNVYGDDGGIIGTKTSFISDGTIGSCTEVTDLEGLRGPESDSSFSVTLESGSGIVTTRFTNYPISDDCRNKLFVAPDILYGCKQGAAVSGVFANGDNDEKCLEGIIPQNLLKACKTSAISNIFQNLNIVPRYLWQQGDRTQGAVAEIQVYHFVPENFTTSTDLSYAFNFHLRLPKAEVKSSNSGTEVAEYDKYYLLVDTSISKDTDSLSRAFTTTYYDSSDGGQFHDATYTTWANFHKYDYGIHFNIMYNIVDRETHKGEDGFNMNQLKYLKVDEIVTPPIAMVCHGFLFNTGFNLNNARKTETATDPVYMLRAFSWSDSNIISRNMILPKATGSWETKNIFYWSSSTSINMPLWKSQVEDIATSEAAYKSMRCGQRYVYFEE